MNSALLDRILDEPAQPAREAWKFIEELKSPLWSVHPWNGGAAPSGTISLAQGYDLECGFPDPHGSLQTAYEDFHQFMQAGGLRSASGPEVVAIRTVIDPAMTEESFVFEVDDGQCRLAASGTEGIRRGIFYLEELMLRAGGPFLPKGIIRQDYPIRNRISRCFFSPIKRAPRNQDELMDDINYYPDEYLNRLAHDGVNGLWLTISLRDLSPTPYFSAFGNDAARRLGKLNDTVVQCARYGIRVYVFCIEPAAFDADTPPPPPDASGKPSAVAGHSTGDVQHFCTSSEEGLMYLENSLKTIFRAVPGLGGLINITMGEGATQCCSGIDGLFSNNCPRCSILEPAEVLAKTQSAMARGMHAVNPNADLISWFYVPGIRETADCAPERAKEVLGEIFSQTPPEIFLQVNCESLGEVVQLGKPRLILDYSLAYVGPSRFFESSARKVLQAGARVSAKLQVGCSHEVATVPFVPVPGNIFRRYQRLHEIGVTSVLQCWYFGNYPSVMTSAANICSRTPWLQSEERFLHDLAAKEWGVDASVVVEAWKRFRDAYEQFPANVHFSHYGPVHDCLTWPLHLVPVDRPIAPSWQFGHPVSGDRIGECFAYYHTLDEILALTARLADGWDAGQSLLDALVHRVSTSTQRRKDIGVSKALALQFRSALNVIQFYAWREELFWLNPNDQLRKLDAMRALVNAEIAGSLGLAELCRSDSRLGFHSEAEGYKYFYEKLHWRADCLETLLQESFPAVQKMIEQSLPLFPGYTGAEPDGPICRCPKTTETNIGSLPWNLAPEEVVSMEPPSACDFRWKALHNDTTLFLQAICTKQPALGIPSCVWGDGADADRIVFSVEPRRLWPCQQFHVDYRGVFFHNNVGVTMDPNCQVIVRSEGNQWSCVLAIPVECFGVSDSYSRPMRVNVERPDLLNKASARWIPQHPLKSRLHFGCQNPKDLGWLLFVK